MRQLAMKRPHLEGLPEIPALPEGYELVVGTSVDAEGLAAVLTASFEDAWDAKRANEVLLEHPDVWATFLVKHRGEVVATASCMHLRDRMHIGYVHFVGTDPGHGGRGLGYVVSLATLHEFRRQGKTEAILTTDDPRIPALKVYLRLGFIPVYEDETHPPRWSAVFETILRRA
jgi:mycothiol synthase